MLLTLAHFLGTLNGAFSAMAAIFSTRRSGDMDVVPALTVRHVPDERWRYVAFRRASSLVASPVASRSPLPMLRVKQMGRGCFFLWKNPFPSALDSMGRMRSSARKRSYLARRSRFWEKVLCFWRREVSVSIFLMQESVDVESGWARERRVCKVGLRESFTMRQISGGEELTASSRIATSSSSSSPSLSCEPPPRCKKEWGMSIRMGLGEELPGMRRRLSCTWTSSSLSKREVDSPEVAEWCLRRAWTARLIRAGSSRPSGVRDDDDGGAETMMRATDVITLL
mmetsp:Transcript_2204/g.4621  ORF Transcript_2204/g.4621 Transcript_2204/m.4621 type:complete len:283 (+) Transcript_2204:226-1074(+)